MEEAVIALLAVAPPPRRVLDLGCGNAGFALLAAAAGYESYGVDIAPTLVAEAERLYKVCLNRNIIGANVSFHVVVGDMILPSHRASYIAFRKQHDENEMSMPMSETPEDIYVKLGIRLEEADVIYCWSWPMQSRFLYNYLEETTKQDCIFVLPAYVRYTQGEHMNEALQLPNKLILAPIRSGHADDLFIGKRAQ